MAEGFFQSGDLRLWYRTVGTGGPLVLLNGGPGMPHTYLRELEQLADIGTLVFYDQRGTGRSGTTTPDGYTIDANVDDLEALRQALGYDSFRLLGHSWGGMLAQSYAVRYPERVSKLILADTLGSIGDLNAALDRMRAAVQPATRAIYDRYEAQGLYSAGETYPAPYQAALDEAYEPVFIGVDPPPYLVNTFANLAYPVYRAMWGDESEFRVTGTLAAFDVERHYDRLQMPVLVIVGASDMPSVDMAGRMAAALPNAHLRVFERSRHFPFIEEPDAFFATVRTFLES